MGNLSCVQQLLCTPGVDVNVKNGRGETAVMIAKDYRVLVLLKKYLKICDDFPVHTVGKVILCGNTGAGKSTLTKVVVDWKLSVCKENAMMIASHPQNVKPLTAGILSHYIPRSDGSIMLYDLAGHLEYYSSHSSCLEAISRSSPSTFLLLTDISKQYFDDIKTELNYWTAMIGNVCCKCPQPSEVIVVGTHTDKLEKDQLSTRCDLLNQSADNAVKKTKHHFAGFIALNVTDHLSDAMTSFMELLFKTIEVVRKHCPAISLNCHVLYAFLMQMVPSGTDAITLSYLLSHLAVEKEHGLGTDISEITSYLTTLSDKGLIVFFPNADHTDSWIVLKQDALLEKVNGTIFAPASFKEYRRSLVSNTGIIPISNLKRLFPNHNVDMISQFLLHSELCQPVVDIIDATKTLSDCVFCPSLVLDSRPSNVIIPQSSFVYLMHTSDGSEFFTTRCLHAIIHRITKQCTLPSEEFKHDKELHCFSRRCTVWSTGIAWKNELGITFVVEMDKSLQCITLAASSDKNKNNPRYPSAYKHVLDVIKKCCEDFCPSVAINMKEHIRCPSLPCLGPTTADVVLSELSNAFLSKSRTLTDVLGEKEVDLEEWLHVEPQLSLLIDANVKEGMPQTSEPTLKELMDEVAAKTSAKWRLIGIQLGVHVASLDGIQAQLAGQPDSCIHAFEQMLSKWKSLSPHRYTWATIIDALEAPSVGAVDVAAELRTKYLG